ncbi:hypothetical protein EIP91_010838 [Steccherinum ochraceum]|uniref:Uncharacterized protein n=1 Tax=Steccherinum ochraceum TaxID=92696 RepID=A0A4R0R068_9APHY|nr:hypothetical protein EIP91_010838 [Steccherinum ochraceum]
MARIKDPKISVRARAQRFLQGIAKRLHWNTGVDLEEAIPKGSPIALPQSELTDEFLIREYAGISDVEAATPGAINRAKAKAAKRQRDDIEETDRYFRRAEKKKTVNGTIITADVSLDELRKREHSEKYFEEAKAKAAEIVAPEWPTQDRSCVVKDKDGNVMLVYLSWHWATQRGRIKTYTSGPKKGERIIIWDGIPKRFLTRFQHDMQDLFSRCTVPWFNDGEKERHPDDGPLMRWQWVGDDGWYYEHKYLCHHFEQWEEQAKATLQRSKPSSDLRGKTEEEFLFNVSKLYNDHLITSLIEAWVLRWFPDEHKKLKESFENGHWVSTEYPAYAKKSGIFLGRVTLWKLQTSLHRDAKDVLCVIFCCGKFQGGELILPDIGLKFRYEPGTVVIFYSQALYHMINTWEPLRREHDDPFTSGRISRVYTTWVPTDEKLRGPDGANKAHKYWLPTTEGYKD